jgi:hypothetical protein
MGAGDVNVNSYLCRSVDVRGDINRGAMAAGRWARVDTSEVVGATKSASRTSRPHIRAELKITQLIEEEYT